MANPHVLVGSCQPASLASFSLIDSCAKLSLSELEKLPNLGLSRPWPRAAADWLKLHGKPILVVETFVDETLHRGTCNKACGFDAIGATAGFAR